MRVLLLFLLLALPLRAETLDVEDKLGRKITLNLPVQRVVAFETYELIPAIKAQSQVVGLNRYAFENDLIKASWPGVEKLANLGSSADVNLEQLLALKPDLVITWSVKPQFISFLEAKGIPTLVLNPENLQEIIAALRLLGKIFAKEQEAEQVVSTMEAMLSRVKTRLQNVPQEKRLKGMWMMSKPNVVGSKNSVLSELLEIAGMDNVVSETQRGWTEVPIERVLLWNPDIIFITGWAAFSPDDVLNNPQWRNLSGAKRKTIWKAPRWSTWSPRLAPLALWLATKAYPDYFKDLDFKASVNDFFQQVYGISYDKVVPFAP